MTNQTWHYQEIKETDENHNQEVDKIKWFLSNDSIGSLPIKNVRIRFSLNLTDYINPNMGRIMLCIPQSPKPYKLLINNQQLDLLH